MKSLIQIIRATLALAGALLIALPCAADDKVGTGPADAAALKQKLAKYLQLDEDISITFTAFPDFYAARFPSGKFSPVFFDKDLNVVLNAYGVGWFSLQGKTKLNEAQVNSLTQKLINSLPLKLAIKMNQGGKGVVMVERTAVDCPECGTQERKLLDMKGFNWVLFPTYLATENRNRAIAVYCSPNPAQAWRTLMVEKKILPDLKDCGYPDEKLRDIAYMIPRGASLAMFKNGTVIRSGQGDELEKAIRTAQDSKAYFD